jgi:hypothetical protein
MHTHIDRWIDVQILINKYIVHGFYWSSSTNTKIECWHPTSNHILLIVTIILYPRTFVINAINIHVCYFYFCHLHVDIGTLLLFWFFLYSLWLNKTVGFHKNISLLFPLDCSNITFHAYFYIQTIKRQLMWIV